MTGILVETDVIVEFLTAPPATETLLRRLLSATTCFTTFIQASEVYSACESAADRSAVDRALFGLKILGASSRYSKTIGAVLTSLDSMRGHRTAIVAAMALESSLPVVTDTHYDVFSAVPGLRLYPAAELRRVSNRDELMKMLSDPSSL
ncbi:MAG: PIN domain-containing protein [bacterium]|nr:PIN domain-containing protein [Candidatus Kapabacteria bacterium]